MGIEMKDLDNAVSLALAGTQLSIKHIEVLAKSTVLDLIDIGLSFAEIEDLRSAAKIELQRHIAQQVTSPLAEGEGSRLEQLLKEELGNMLDVPALGAEAVLSFIDAEDEALADDHDEDKKIMGHGGAARMARQQLYTIAQAAQGLYDSLSDDDEIPEWSQSHIAQAEQMLDNVAEYLQYKILRSEMHDG